MSEGILLHNTLLNRPAKPGEGESIKAATRNMGNSQSVTNTPTRPAMDSHIPTESQATQHKENEHKATETQPTQQQDPNNQPAQAQATQAQATQAQATQAQATQGQAGRGGSPTQHQPIEAMANKSWKTRAQATRGKEYGSSGRTTPRAIGGRSNSGSNGLGTGSSKATKRNMHGRG